MLNGRTATVPTWAQHVLWLGALSAIVYCIHLGRLATLSIVVLGAWSLLIIARWPMIGVLLLVVAWSGARSNVYYLGFLPSATLPLIGTVNTPDVVLLIVLLVGVRNWVERGEKPLFWAAILAYVGCILLSNGSGLLAGVVTWRSFSRGIRNRFLGYAFYVGCVGVVDTRKRLWSPMLVVILLSVYGTSSQLMRLGAPASGSGTLTDVAGRAVMYTRPGSMTFLVLLVALLSFGSLAVGSRRLVFVAPMLASSMSMLLTLVRQVYVMFASAILSMLLPRSRERAKRMILLGLAVVGVFVLLNSFSPLFEQALGDDAISTVVARASMLLLGTEDQTIGGRAELVRFQINFWLHSPNPLLGFGFLAEHEGITLTDTGFPNTLILLGVLGLVATLYLWWAVFRRALGLCRSLGASPERGVALGVFGYWCALLVGYVAAQDFFVRPGLEVSLAMVIVDVLHRLAEHGLLPLDPCAVAD